MPHDLRAIILDRLGRNTSFTAGELHFILDLARLAEDEEVMAAVSSSFDPVTAYRVAVLTTDLPVLRALSGHGSEEVRTAAGQNPNIASAMRAKFMPVLGDDTP